LLAAGGRLKTLFQPGHYPLDWSAARLKKLASKDNENIAIAILLIIDDLFHGDRVGGTRLLLSDLTA
jgi:hypothetical protein